MAKYFGTDGIRGKCPEWLTPEIAYKVGYALGAELNAIDIIIGRDTRKSGVIINQALNQGALDAGCKTINLGVVTTPMVQFLSLKQKTYGIMITASHNASVDNGIKVIFNGMKASTEQESIIEEVIDQNIQIPKEFIAIEENKNLLDSYFLAVNNLKIPKTSINVVLDTAHGSLTPFAKKILEAHCRVKNVIGNHPNGLNINEKVGSMHMEALQSATPRGFIGLSFDGDGDRLIAVDEHGQIVTGDQLLALINHLLQISSKIVLTQMVNPGIKAGLKDLSYEVIETRVGDKYVLDSMKTTRTPVGGEDSGHMIFNQTWPIGDGIISALVLLKTLHENDISLYNAAQNFSKYPEDLMNFKGISRKQFLQNTHLDEFIRNLRDSIENDHGKLLVRPSGTEDVIRVYVSLKQKIKLDFYKKELISLFKSYGGTL